MIATVLKMLSGAFAGLLLADFASGAIHWVIDRYCPGTHPWIGRHFVGLIHEHHERPHAMFALSPLRRNAGFCILVGGLFLVFAMAGWLNIVTWSAFVFGALANQIHCWAHRRPRHAAGLILGLQRLGLLQSPRHHGVHHGPSPTACYCLITNFVNPIVDRIRLWERAEAGLAYLGVRPKTYVSPNPFYRTT